MCTPGSSVSEQRKDGDVLALAQIRQSDNQKNGPRSENCLNWPRAAGKECFLYCMNTLQSQVEVGLYAVGFRNTLQSQRWACVQLALHVSSSQMNDLILGVSSFFWNFYQQDLNLLRQNELKKNLFFCSFTFSQIDIDFLSHKVCVTPHQNSGMWAV